MKNIFTLFTIDQLYKRSALQSSGILWLATGIVLLGYILLQPRSIFLSLPLVREWRVQQFISTVIKTQNFEMQKFWQLRDQLGGVASHNPAAVEPYSILHIKKIELSPTLLLTIAGPQFSSHEYLVSADELQKIQSEIPIGEALFQESNVSINYDQPGQTIRIQSIYPFETMKKYNGMIDYQVLEEDLANWWWVVETDIQVSPNFNLQK